MQNIQDNLAAYYEEVKTKKGIKKAVQDVTPRPFYDRFKGAAWVAQIAQYGLFSIFSIVAGFFLIWGIFSAIVPPILAGFLAAAFLIFWEAFKSFSLNKSFESFYVYNKVNILFILLGLGALGLSSYVSIIGARDAAVFFTDQSTIILEQGGTKAASLDDTYQQRIKETQNKIDGLETLKKDRAKKEGGSAWLTNVENQQSKNYTEILLSLNKEREVVLAETKAAANGAAEKSTQAGKKNGGALLIISGLNEALIFACIWFVWWFKQSVKEEQKALGEALGAETPDNLSIIRLAYQNMFTPPAIHIEMQGKQEQAPQISEMPQKPFLGFQYTSNEGTKGGAYMPTPDRLNADRLNADRLNADRLNADRLNADRLTVKYCQYEKCGKAFEYKSFAKKFCGEDCRRLNWEAKTGATLKKPKPKK